jgi:cell division protease FtsH
MVCEFGMSEAGPLSFGKKDEPIFLGRQFTQHADYSELTAKRIDKEVRDIVTGAYKRASQLINENLSILHRVADALLEKETLNRAEINELFSGLALPVK